MTEITLDHKLLSRMMKRAAYEMPTGEDAERIVFFGIRGALPLDTSGTGFEAAHGLTLTPFDHLHMRCTLGQWNPKAETLAVFPGSTVPHEKGIRKSMARGGRGTNMLSLGRYRYKKGVHHPSSQNGHRAFRQHCFFPVWRSADDLDYDLNDEIDMGEHSGSYVWDNLHAAFADSLDRPRFASNGCQVIAGHPKSRRRGNRPETGPWKRFIDLSYGGLRQTVFDYALFSGREAGLVAHLGDRELRPVVRFGSGGPRVKAVQKALKAGDFPFLETDGKFGRGTMEAVIAFQEAEFGIGGVDGLVGPNTAAALGVDWKTLA